MPMEIRRIVPPIIGTIMMAIIGTMMPPKTSACR